MTQTKTVSYVQEVLWALQRGGESAQLSALAVSLLFPHTMLDRVIQACYENPFKYFYAVNKVTVEYLESGQLSVPWKSPVQILLCET